MNAELPTKLTRKTHTATSRLFKDFAGGTARNPAPLDSCLRRNDVGGGLAWGGVRWRWEYSVGKYSGSVNERRQQTTLTRKTLNPSLLRRQESRTRGNEHGITNETYAEDTHGIPGFSRTLPGGLPGTLPRWIPAFAGMTLGVGWRGGVGIFPHLSCKTIFLIYNLIYNLFLG